MRQGELLGLKWQDIDWERQALSISRQLKRIPNVGFEFTPTKTKSGVRKVAIGKETLRILKNHQQQLFAEMQMFGEDWQDLDLVFPTTIGTPIHIRKLLRKFKKLIKEVGLPEIRFHDLRHTAASLMLNQGIPLLIVSRRLGHANPSITLDIYGHIIPSMQEQAAEVMDEIVTPIRWENCTQTTPGTKYPSKKVKKIPPYLGQNLQYHPLCGIIGNTHP
jgi:integrase